MKTRCSVLIIVMSLLLSVMFLGATPVVNAEDTDDSYWTDHFQCKYDKATHTLTITAMSDPENQVNSSTLRQLPWIDYKDEVEHVILQNTVTEIVPHAFNGFYSLASVDISKGITSIGDYAFEYCFSLTSISIPDSVTSIGNYAFLSCHSLTSITIPEGVTSIGNDAFSDCSSLTSITILEGVTSIGNRAFSNCGSLTSITIPESVTCIGNTAFLNCNSLTSITIPESVKSIDWGTFSGCVSLTSITIPEGVTSIGGAAFKGCHSLTSIIIPDSVTSIGNCAFMDCTNLTSITIPSSVKSIDWGTFSGCASLTSITIPEGVTSIGDYAFCRCRSLTSITIPNGVTSIGNSALSGCTSLTSITIPSSVKDINCPAFQGCAGLSGIWVDSDNSTYSSNESGVLFNKEKTELLCCPGGFSGTYEIPDSVTSIGSSAFEGCTGLTNVTIPDSVTSIDSSAFSDCTSLTSITIPEGVTSIGGYAFCGCSSLTSITIPEGVTSIRYRAFYCCSSLTSITIPNGVTSIGDDVFSGCSSLTSITIPESVTSIGDKAFGSCNSLKVVAFLGEKPSINSSAFASVTADAYYPESLDSDSSWKKSGALSGYGGTLNWKPWYTLGDNLFCEHVLEDTVVPPTCTWGYTLHKCACGYSYRTDFEPGCGHDMITDAAVPATCTETGLTEGSHCSRCDYKIAQKVMPALGHDFIDHAAKAATCTEIGWEAYQTCSRCDYTTYKEISALGHDWGAPVYDWADDHSAITATRVCKRDPDHTETENGVVTSAVTKEATYDAEGEITYTATFTNPAFEPQTAVVSLPRLERPTPTPAENPFTDIRESAYYHDPVLWAVANNVTNGTSDSTFSPDEGCTRAQVVTFLWRYEEQPASVGTSNPFADVKPSAYFGSAVLWAVEKGITNGTSATTFDPEDTCTRAQVVTFLYRDIVKS